MLGVFLNKDFARVCRDLWGLLESRVATWCILLKNYCSTPRKLNRAVDQTLGQKRSLVSDTQLEEVFWLMEIIDAGHYIFLRRSFSFSSASRFCCRASIV